MPSKTKSKRKKGIVSFEEEVVDKDKATGLLSKLPKPEPVSETTENIQIPDKKLHKRQKRKQKDEVEEKLDNKILDVDHKSSKSEENLVTESISTELIKKKKHKKSKVKLEHPNTDSNQTLNKKVKKKKVKLEGKNDNNEECVEGDGNNKNSSKDNTTELNDTEADIADNSNIPVNKEESKRAKKRKKHMEQLAAKKLKASVATQESALNYLSKWKHSKAEWKFEKLKQIWLSQNLFDPAKIPEEFWETVVEYFSQSRGFIRKLIMREALKIVEEEDKAEEENTNEEYLSKVKRARSIVQNLQD